MKEARQRQDASRERPADARSPASRMSIGRLFVVALLAWAAWQIVSDTAADSYAVERPETALAWVGNHPTALVAYAEEQLASETSQLDADAIADLAKRALIANPLEAKALRVMASAAEMSGDDDRADSLMRLAGSRSLRDLETQAWLFSRGLSAKSYPEALSHLDAILRVWPGVSDRFLPVLVGLADDPDGQTSLIALLKDNPPWRSWLLTRLPANTQSPAGLAALYLALESGTAPLTIDEFRPYLLRLVTIGDYARAYAMQVDFLPPERIPALGLLNNGGFDFPVSGLPFDWTIGSIRGARTEVVVDDTANRVLRVEFYNTRVPYQHVTQLLLLRPGAYRLVGEVKPVNLRNDRGMQWVVQCADGTHERLGETKRVTGSGPWTHFEAPVVVPNRSDCQAQVVRLVLAARIPAEQKAGGEVWYDALRIERDDTAAAPSAGDSQL